MAFVDDPNNNSQSNNIAGSSPLGNTASSEQGSSVPSGDAQPSSQPSTIQSSSKPASTNVKAPKASSGMFTNIQKYVNKNKPSAQNMAESSVADIRKTQDDLKQKQQDNLAKFTTNAQQGGLHDTQARVADVGSYASQEGGLNTEQPSESRTVSGFQRQEPKLQSQQTIVGGEMKEYDNSNPRKITNPYEGKVAGDTAIRQKKDNWGRFVGSEEYTITQDMIDNWSNPVRQPVDRNISQTTTEQPEQVNTGINENRFSDILNANYTGPRNLTETGNLYQNSLEAANKASRVGQMSQSIEGREQLLRDKFTQGGKQYTQGASQLDNLLLGHQTPQIAQMQDLGRQIGSTEDIMRRFTSGATDIANQTAEQVQATKDQARAEFQRVAQERQGQVDSRVGDVVENWDTLPAHFRAALSNPDGTVNLSKVEAATLGVGSGEGLYNLTGQDLFGDGVTDRVQADRSRLATTNEQQNLARLQALSNLAQGGDKLYDINQSDYSDADLAGTQTAFDALDIEGVRQRLADAEQGFRDTAAQDTVGTGEGSKYYKRSLGRTGRANATVNKTGTLQDQLKDRYNFDSDINRDVTDNRAYLDALSSMSNPEQVQADSSDLNIGNAVGDSEKTKGSDSDDLIDNIGNMSGNITEGLGELAGAPSREISDKITKIFGENNDLGKALNMPLNLVSDLAGNIGKGLSDLGGSVFGSGKSAAKKTAYRNAEIAANSDLVNKLQKAYEDSGFQNRIGVADTEENAARNQQLMDLLSRLDKSNI